MTIDELTKSLRTRQDDWSRIAMKFETRDKSDNFHDLPHFRSIHEHLQFLRQAVSDLVILEPARGSSSRASIYFELMIRDVPFHAKIVTEHCPKYILPGGRRVSRVPKVLRDNIILSIGLIGQALERSFTDRADAPPDLENLFKGLDDNIAAYSEALETHAYSKAQTKVEPFKLAEPSPKPEGQEAPATAAPSGYRETPAEVEGANGIRGSNETLPTLTEASQPSVVRSTPGRGRTGGLQTPPSTFVPVREIHDDLFTRGELNDYMGGNAQATNITIDKKKGLSVDYDIEKVTFPRLDINPECPTEIGASGSMNNGFGHDRKKFYTVPEERTLFVGVRVLDDGKVGYRYMGQYRCTRAPDLPPSVWKARSHYARDEYAKYLVKKDDSYRDVKTAYKALECGKTRIPCVDFTFISYNYDFADDLHRCQIRRGKRPDGENPRPSTLTKRKRAGRYNQAADPARRMQVKARKISASTKQMGFRKKKKTALPQIRVDEGADDYESDEESDDSRH